MADLRVLRVLCGEFSAADLSRIPIFGFLLAMPETTISPPSQRIRGVLAPVVTPFKADLSPDRQRFIRHCQWLLSQNCGLAVFGTNSEANSMSAEERSTLLEALVAAGIDPSRVMPGTGCCSITETVELTAHAVKHGCGGVLMLPPFYYKDVSEEGLYRYFSEVVQRVGDTRLRIYLYHIPPVAIVGITPKLVERLLKSYPNAIAGMKDSSGDWNNGADGISDIEGKAPRVGASERSRGDASDIDGQTERSKWAGAHESTWATNEFQSRQLNRASGDCGFRVSCWCTGYRAYWQSL